MDISSAESRPSSHGLKAVDAVGQVDTPEVLRDTWPQVSPETIVRLARAALLVQKGPGPAISDAEVPGRLALVLRGTLAVVWNSPDGRRALWGLVGPRELVGVSTLGEGAIPGDIDALTDVTLLTWVTRDFKAIAVSDRQLTVDLLERSVYALQNSIYMFKMRTFTTARSRLAGLLLRYEPYCFGDAPLISRGQLGDLAGVSVRMASSIIRRWEAAGIIRRIGVSGLVLVDRAALDVKAAPFNEFPPPDPPIRAAAHATRQRQTG